MTENPPGIDIAHGRTLTIKIGFTDFGSEWKFYLPNGRAEPILFECDLSRENASAVWAQLRKAFDQFRRVRTVHPVRCDWDRVSLTLHQFHSECVELAVQLFNRSGWSRVKEIFQSLYQDLPYWKAELAEPLLVEVEENAKVGEVIPVECLPVFDPLDEQQLAPLTITNTRELDEFMRRFLGFSMLVGRRFRRNLPPIHHFLENKPRLPLKFFRHAALRGVKKELDFLRRQGSMVELVGPWLDRASSKFTDSEIAKELAKHLANPSLDFAGARRPLPDQIQHFACHCDTTDRIDATNHSLTLAHHPRARDRHITIGQLETYFGMQGRPAENGPFPLIFFNACGSAVNVQHEVTSFLKFFLKTNGNRGFIGTETLIPDQVAAVFSVQFYRKLLEGASLAKAIHFARWTLLRRYNNPLGILYSVYADPNIRLRY